MEMPFSPFEHFTAFYERMCSAKSRHNSRYLGIVHRVSAMMELDPYNYKTSFQS